tara:strand:- start:107 stop:532 length:426 start_codon:yes stop_codon:yes gene_type:complete
MIHLTPSTSAQTIRILPRVYSNSLAISLRDDSTGTSVLLYPTTAIVGNYVDLTTVFTLVEGRYYDIKVYLGDFTKRVLADGGDMEALSCIQDIDAYDDLDIIYRDKIFATTQTINQETNNYYTPNKDSFISESGDNDFIFI